MTLRLHLQVGVTLNKNVIACLVLVSTLCYNDELSSGEILLLSVN